MPERKLGKIEKDFLEAKEITKRTSEGLKEKFDWIEDFRFAGDISFKPNRTKVSIQEATERNEEVSFGLNMIMTYYDIKKIKRETEVVIKYRVSPFYDIMFKSYIKNSVLADVTKQFKNIWIILASGGTPEAPTAFIVTKLGEYPEQCFTSTTNNRWKISFNKYLKWKSAKQLSIFGDDMIADEFNKIRKEKYESK